MTNRFKFRALYMRKVYNVTGMDFAMEQVSMMPDNIGNVPFDSVILMQSTGTEDKNGKEIFEGDIVTAIAEEEYSDDTITSDVIFSNKFSYEIRCGEGYKHGLSIVWGGWETLEIIGNIYENHELLKWSAKKTKVQITCEGKTVEISRESAKELNLI